VESIKQIIFRLSAEADISSRSLIFQIYQRGTFFSWIYFVLEIEETSNELELELKDIAKYHKRVQPLLKQSYKITAKILSIIIDSDTY
jgi:hypothetical protein